MASEDTSDFTQGELEVKRATLSVVKMKLEKIESLVHTPMAFHELVKLRREVEREMNLADAQLRRFEVPDQGEG